MAGFLVKATPVPEVSPIFPNTIDCTFTAVPQSPGISFSLLYTIALGLSHEPNTAVIAANSCSLGSCGKSSLISFLYISLNLTTIFFKSSDVKSVSYSTPFSSFTWSNTSSKSLLSMPITTSENI